MLNDLTGYILNVENLKLDHGLLICAVCGRSLKRKLDRVIGTCQFCRERGQSNMRNFTPTKTGAVCK